MGKLKLEIPLTDAQLDMLSRVASAPYGHFLRHAGKRTAMALARYGLLDVHWSGIIEVTDEGRRILAEARRTTRQPEPGRSGV